MSDPDSRILREPAVRWVAPDVGAESQAGVTTARAPSTGAPSTGAPLTGALSTGAPPGYMTVDKLEALQKSAFDEAFAQGLEAGRQEGRAELARQVEYLQRCVEALSEPFRDLDEEVEQALVSLAIRVARQIIRRELKFDPGQIVGVVRETIELLPVASRNVEVHLHPEDAAVVRAAFGEAGTNLAWTLIEDPVLTRGGLRVTTDTSQIDARVEKRLETILATLVGGEREEDA